MSNIESIVKVMNFHALLRVDKSKRLAEKYFEVEKKLNRVICEIYYNRNLTLDKKIIYEHGNGDIINVFIGNDLGFCGNFNSLVAREMAIDEESNKIVIGKKIDKKSTKNVIINIQKTKFSDDFDKIKDTMYEHIRNKNLKEVNIIYNHYYNTNDIRLEKVRIFPADFSKEDDLDLDVDFANETNVSDILSSLLSYYICYQIKIAEANSVASENVMREKITHEAKKKIQELNDLKIKEERKEKNAKSFKKQIDNYRKIDG